MEEPINVRSGRGGWNEGYPKTRNVGMPAGINEDIRLDKRECVINVWPEEGAYDFEVPVDYVKFVQVFYAACYFRQLASRH